MSTLLYSALTLRREQAVPPPALVTMKKEASEMRTAAAAAATAGKAQAPELTAVADAAQATADKADAEKPPDFLDTVVALVPAEVIAAHALVLGAASTKTTDSSGAVTTSLNPDHLKLDETVWWALVVLAALLYIVPHWVQSRAADRGLDTSDFLRMLIPALAFWVWTMIQTGTLFDAVGAFTSWSPVFRAALGAIVGIVLLIASKALTSQADKATPEGAAAGAAGT